MITLHGSPAFVLGVTPATRNFYIFSRALDRGGSVELGDIAVVPSNPVDSVVIGNVDSGIGIQRLDACGDIVAPTFGTFPATLPAPLPPISKGGINNRGVAFSAVTGQAFSPGMLTTLLDGSGPYGTLFTFGQNGGAGPILLASGSLVDALVAGGIASDELGTFYLAQSFGSAVSAFNGAQSPLTERPIASGAAEHRDAVHDGNGHLFVTSRTEVLRIDVGSGLVRTWASSRAPFGDSGSFSDLYGITIDASGNLWVVERIGSDAAALVELSGTTGQVLDYIQFPQLVGGFPAAGNRPQGIAVHGVNLPAVREACASACASSEITDCFGNCLPADYLGDQFCDDGPHQSLNCYSRGFDAGDCNPCGPGEKPDCNGTCGPSGWIGDGICDQGGGVSSYNGSLISFDCAEFRYDEATCRNCNAGEVLDCNGNCAPASWFGDSLCDDGWAEYLGNLVSFDCVEYDFDQHVCH